MLTISTAHAATVRGTVAATPHVAIWLEGPRGPVPQRRAARLDEVWMSFVPKVQLLPRGSTLVLSNRDEESHTVHGRMGNQSLFNLATVPRGVEQRVTLDRPGVVTFLCDLHREMRAYVLVSDAAFTAVTDVSGAFEIAGVPDGHYRVRAWTPPGTAHDESDLGETLAEVDVHGADPAPLALKPPFAIKADRPVASPAFVPDPPLHTPSDYAPIKPGWPHTGWLVQVLSALGILLVLAGAVANYKLVARLGWSKVAAVLLGCAMAIASGLTIVLGLHGAIAIALGFGWFIGTAVFGASET